MEKAHKLWKRHSFGKGSQGFGKGTGVVEKAHWKRHRNFGKGSQGFGKSNKVHKALEKAQCVGSRNMISLLARNKTHQFCLEKCLAPASEILISHLKS